jgi:hypothetical protein
MGYSAHEDRDKYLGMKSHASVSLRTLNADGCGSGGLDGCVEYMGAIDNWQPQHCSPQ